MVSKLVAIPPHLIIPNLRPLEAIEWCSKRAVDINQSPIGRTPRSNPATYTGAFTPIRDWFTELPESKIRGYKVGRFSFNVKGGRCDACEGDGVIKVEMHFLPDVYVPCDVCHGKRYNRETLDIRYKGKNIHEVLSMTIEQAHEFFEAVPIVKRKLKTLLDVGLGYVKLGQSATTLSGGEAQRLKLAGFLAEAAKAASNSRQPMARRGTLFMLDEPTTGLHFDDIAKLMRALRKLLEGGHSLIVIEHNLDVIRASDWLIDLGPEGGDAGGYVVAEGMPEEVRNHSTSHTALALREYAVAMGEFGGLLNTSEATNSMGDRVTPSASYASAKSLPGATRSPTDLVGHKGSNTLTAAEQNSIRIVNAKEHNLKNIDVAIPLQRLVCVTGTTASCPDPVAA